MRFAVEHETIYRYSQPVWLAAHVLRFNPRLDGVTLLTRSLTIEPEPADRREATDSFGNAITHVEFAGASDRLRIVSQFELRQIAVTSPVDPHLPPLPWTGVVNDGLAPYRTTAGREPAVEAFAARLASEARGSATNFLDRLNQALFVDFKHEIRDGGGARTPAETLAAGRGACRDVTVLFIAACRSLGIASRFVSGYQAEADTPDGRRHLHAWPEAFLPDAGWRGYDPTHGLIVAGGHVALCAAPEQAATMPVEGGYYGAAVASTLDYDVRIETSEE